MSFEPRRISTAKELRALSHPLRLDILEQLTLRGAMTATELGDALGETPANCSWHLRKLAEHGFVEEAGAGRGRRRPWQVVKVGLVWDEAASSAPGYRSAGQALSAQLLEREVARWRRNSDASPHGWGDVGMSQAVVVLTEEEATAFAADLAALLLRHHGRLTGDEPVPKEARHVHVLALTSVDPQ
ncbi:ArsR/SmtB family transcription factor [Terrabacter sp. 2RAF25]|uniref:ArsR/SmtB family transcription factor n=1 Tax=Terrabacter sp. 2RAF25 TaxID=3232998 RepID=UPI003F952B9A